MTHSGFSSSAVDIEGAHLQDEALAFARTREPLIVVHLPKLMTCGLAAPKAALVNHARQKSMRDKKRYMLPSLCIRQPTEQGQPTPTAIVFPIGNWSLSASPPQKIVYNKPCHLRQSDEPLPETTENHFFPLRVLQRHGRSVGSAISSSNSRGGRQSGHHGADAGTAGHPRL